MKNRTQIRVHPAYSIATGFDPRDNVEMASIKRPEGFEIAALREKRTDYFDLMTPGSGTPWEERGNFGLFVAFFKTAFASMFSPLKLAYQIRRPETMTDARGFLFGCSLFWALSWAIHSTIYYYRTIALPNWHGDAPTYFMGVALKCVLGFFAPMLLLRLYCALYYKLIATEFPKTSPVVLILNVKAYCMGPSLLAIIPFAGPPIALIWLLISFCIVGRSRLRLSAGGAIVGAIVSLVVTLAIGVGIVYGAGLVFELITGGGLEEYVPGHRGGY